MKQSRPTNSKPQINKTSKNWDYGSAQKRERLKKDVVERLYTDILEKDRIAQQQSMELLKQLRGSQ